jgi:hypothetical protein
MYVWANLGKGVPHDRCFTDSIQHIRQKVVQCMLGGPNPARWKKQLNRQVARLQRKERELIEDQLTAVLLEVQERRLAQRLFEQSSLDLFVRKLSEAGPDVLRQELKNNDPLARLLTLEAIARRRVHLEKEVIDCFKDPHPAVRDAAHRTMVRLARGTDLGPQRGSSMPAITRSADRWMQWLALQEGSAGSAVAQGGAPAGSTARGTFDPATAVRSVLQEPNTRVLQTADPAVARLCDDLVKATDEGRPEVLARLRDTKGVEHTDALVLAIPKLEGSARHAARQALAQRLTRMTAATLRTMLQDDDAEVRRAAAVACGRKKAAEHVPDLLPLLDDPEAEVVQTARAALRALSGEDFGPGEGAGRDEHRRAVAAWREWWRGRQAAPK